MALATPEDGFAALDDGGQALQRVGGAGQFGHRAGLLGQQPLRRMTTAADIASAVLWISSPLAARQVIAVGGGSAMPEAVRHHGAGPVGLQRRLGRPACPGTVPFHDHG
jgi:hypothetical protein